MFGFAYGWKRGRLGRPSGVFDASGVAEDVLDGGDGVCSCLTWLASSSAVANCFPQMPVGSTQEHMCLLCDVDLVTVEVVAPDVDGMAIDVARRLW